MNNAIGITGSAMADAAQRDTKDEAVADLREMRRRLIFAGRGYYSDGARGFSALDAIAANINSHADALGLSGEDRFTFMAWQLLLAARGYERQLLDMVNVAPLSVVVKAGSLREPRS